MITTFKIHKKYDDSFELAVKWYSILSILNNFSWSPLEIKVMAFTAIRGDISSGGRKEQFCSLTGSTKASVGNVICTLSKKDRGFLVKVDGKIRVNPQFNVNFEGDILTKLHLENVRKA